MLNFSELLHILIILNDLSVQSKMHFGCKKRVLI